MKKIADRLEENQLKSSKQRKVSECGPYLPPPHLVVKVTKISPLRLFSARKTDLDESLEVQREVFVCQGELWSKTYSFIAKVLIISEVWSRLLHSIPRAHTSTHTYTHTRACATLINRLLGFRVENALEKYRLNFLG